MANILLVDDELLNRRLLRTILESAAHTVTEAEDGTHGLALLQATTFDLVITDIQMPDMSGIDLVMHLRADPQLAATKVVFCTNMYPETKVRALALSHNVAYVIPLPAEAPQTLAIVDAALRGVAYDQPPTLSAMTRRIDDVIADLNQHLDKKISEGESQ